MLVRRHSTNVQTGRHLYQNDVASLARSLPPRNLQVVTVGSDSTCYSPRREIPRPRGLCCAVYRQKEMLNPVPAAWKDPEIPHAASPHRKMVEPVGCRAPTMYRDIPIALVAARLTDQLERAVSLPPRTPIKFGISPEYERAVHVVPFHRQMGVE
ncbi:hypothetical protein EPUS_00667 [Endocarpon pusillum Z07020]|uniref:Uncharacterized protein n=1 Tax=Endocarpon pusillum (strain Z07020 / HMAS-L-300199) TaxID=1263415 RepID=U1GHU9_ENDPU|nr:uncharacterized protein EPUS_00667 [Endocarpon pusillum Z07020]ERF71678.1 hypothetical protein EPUS_00667 [Endocarpon pusillum Z07020]